MELKLFLSLESLTRCDYMDLSWEKEKNLETPFTVSSSRFFASVKQDGNFDEDCGFWFPPVKVLDKLRFLKDGNPLETDEVIIEPGFVQMKGSIDGKNWRQTWFCPIDETACVVKFESEMDSIEADLEASYLKASSPTREKIGVSSWTIDDKMIEIKSKENRYHTSVICNKPLNFDEESKEIKLESGEAIIVVAGSPDSKEQVREAAKETLKNQEKILEKKKEYMSDLVYENTHLDSPDEELNKAFAWAKIAVDMLYHEGSLGEGYFAGLPEFPRFFGRDTIWSILGVNSFGCFEKVRNSLETLGDVQSEEVGRCKLPGEIPHEFSSDGSEVHYNSSDASTLWVKGVHDYLMWSGDYEFLEENYEKIRKATEWGFEKDENDDLLVENWMELFSESPLFLIDTSWMDTKIRWKAAVDVQGIWHEALICAKQMAERVGDEVSAEKFGETATKLEEKINDLYWNEDDEYFYDTKGLLRMSGSTTSNPIILALFDVADDDKKGKIFDKIGSEEFTTEWGVRSVSEDDLFYIPGGLGILSYHNGKVWPLITGWCCAAEYRNHRVDIAKEHLDSFKRLTGLASPGVLPETVRGDEMEPADCYHQVWSSAMFVYDVVCGLFGVEPNAFDGSVSVEPHIPEGWDSVNLEDLAIGDNSISLSFFRLEEGWKVELEVVGSLNVDLSMPVEAEVVERDGEEISFEEAGSGECEHTGVSIGVEGSTELVFRG